MRSAAVCIAVAGVILLAMAVACPWLVKADALASDSPLAGLTQDERDASLDGWVAWQNEAVPKYWWKDGFIVTWVHRKNADVLVEILVQDRDNLKKLRADTDDMKRELLVRLADDCYFGSCGATVSLLAAQDVDVVYQFYRLNSDETVDSVDIRLTRSDYNAVLNEIRIEQWEQIWESIREGHGGLWRMQSCLPW